MNASIFPKIVFVTACTKDRRYRLDSESVHKLLRGCWEIRPTWLVGRYMIMPDHLPMRPLSLGLKFWKSRVTAQWMLPRMGSVWQRHHWDTQMRRGDNYEQKWWYVLNNPVRGGLVSKPEDWPYQGELNVLEW